LKKVKHLTSRKNVAVVGSGCDPAEDEEARKRTAVSCHVRREGMVDFFRKELKKSRDSQAEE